MLHFPVKLDLCFSETKCANISESCWCSFILCDFLLRTDVPKHLPLFIILILEKNSHTQSRCWYFVLSVFLSLCISKATLFAFTGSALCHESTLSAVVNVQVTFTFPQIDWIFVLGDCVVLACRLSWERDWTGASYFR